MRGNFFERFFGSWDQMNMALQLQDVWQHIQRQLFPVLVEEVGDLTDKDRLFVEIMALVPSGPLMESYRWQGIGRKPEERQWIFNAFIAKATYQFSTTRALIDALKARPTLRRLCGWQSAGDLPEEWTFSRAFAAFAADELPQRVHGALVQAQQGDKIAGHVSRDATAIEGRERPVRKPATETVPALPKKRGRPKKGEVRPEAPPKRLELQPQRSLAENLADLPRVCDIGCKANSKGHTEYWVGYKLHLDCIDGDIPVSAILTSASVHDSQAAIPLAQMTAQRVTALYELMDSAYDAPAIPAFIRGLGHVPIIDPNPRRGEVIPLDPAQEERFKERSTAERVNSNLKDNFGGRFVRVRGACKVIAHLMFGLIALTAVQFYQRLC
jgi:hypothetical protein